MKLFKFLLILFVVVTSPRFVQATGLSKPVNIGPKAIGMGGAFVGIADDPTAIYHNPAGMTQLKSHQLHFGLDALITDLNYTPPGLPKEKGKTEYLPVPNFGYVTDFAKPISLGLGLFFPHGNGGKFSTSSAVPTNPNEGQIYSMEIAPAVAWEIFPTLSIGASLRVVRISSSLKGQALPTGDVLQDLDLSGWAVGASGGILYKPCQFFSLGANYRSKVSWELDGDATFALAGKLDAKLEQTLPTVVTAGVGISPFEQLTLGLSYGFERNSEIDILVLELPTAGQSIPVPQNWTDSHTIHFGGEYWVLPELALRAGYAKDFNRSIPNTVQNRIIADIAAHEVSAGLAYKWDRYTFGATWNARFGERNVPVNGTANVAPGKYEAFVQSISLGVGVGI